MFLTHQIILPAESGDVFINSLNCPTEQQLSRQARFLQSVDREVRLRREGSDLIAQIEGLDEEDIISALVAANKNPHPVVKR